ncbi:LPPG:FO 2-phospho-L-lactate transferase [Mesorhizobium soli]|uniref:2-phospho-L-lactate transferase n=1 Tax=Pseudaminobacter soli (ex Li et al. 2025) TaxID=1295366 RepID=UPI002475E90D|nr:2-phospho-L-lactate transferase [Mesorhizobium soli]MDH6233749.1 LPPG:FO 2-phospho-L-lactate transferase [Mesorhizobium soli]
MNKSYPERAGRVVALCGGVGGAKLAFGLAHILGNDLTLLVNTGDDFEHLGLTVSPDIDTVLYTLSGLANRELGWGRQGESWNFMEALSTLGGETWFRLGDRDLAIHVERTRRLRAGETLSTITSSMVDHFGIEARVFPMSDQKVSTVVATPEGPLPFQRYFVERRCAPRVAGITFQGAVEADAPPQVISALNDPALRTIIICPSNPYLSIDPILAVPGIRSGIERADVPVIAVSPIIGGKAVKGPTAKIMAELAVPATSKAIAEHYGGVIDGLVIDHADADDRETVNCPVHVTTSLMTSDEDRIRLAGEVLDFAYRLAPNAEAITLRRGQ